MWLQSELFNLSYCMFRKTEAIRIKNPWRCGYIPYHLPFIIFKLWAIHYRYGENFQGFGGIPRGKKL
ncbi:hypothetical protein DO97_17560 [Neosynechococcus sphagnicola sy1]|uniref:Uncharacterized protein n=1 Tax=Neosynechococcus sphagnicola sy1 TaxID=1497020 RepID=A0A098THZ4_9CYAN|nr:hypothetical protein DO97_17560 [Neosynechococcus sphagnicola sy1]